MPLPQLTVSSLHRDDINSIERLIAKEVLVGTTSRVGLPSRPHCKMNGNKIDTERHECRQCFIIFSNEQSMLRHNKKFHEEEHMQLLQKNNTVFLCYKCNQRFQTSAKLRQHNLSHGTDDKPFRCEICREGYSKFEELLNHRREVCPKRKFHCKVCGMNFQNLDSLETHKSIHVPRRRGRPAKKKETEWGTADEETMSPEKEDEEEDDEEEEELDGRVEDQRASGSPDMKTPGPDEEAQGRASESQQPGYNIPCSVDYCDLTFTSLEALRVHKQGNHRPQPATQSDTQTTTPGKNTIVPKEEEEEEEEQEGDGRAEDQRALRAQTSGPQGSASKSQLPTKRSQLTMEHGCPAKRMATVPGTADTKTALPKEEEEEEEEVDDRSDAQRALRAHTSSPQGQASESQQPGYNIPCPVDDCELTFPSVEALRMHKKDVHRPQPVPELAPLHLP